jgi:hypothetical protein
MKKLYLLIILTIVLSSVAVLALESVMLADQGSGVKLKTNGSVVNGDLEVTVWNTTTGGTPIYNETFASAIVNGSWNVMLGENSSNNLTLEYMGLYYKDYKIAGEDADFGQFNGSTAERQVFNSPLGDIHESDFNQSSNLTISNITMGSRITFALGEMIDNTLDGLIAITGDLQATGTLTSLGGRLTLGGIASEINSTNPTANITLATVNIERMRLTASQGLVGINNSNPSGALDVNGTVYARGIFQQGDDVSKLIQLDADQEKIGLGPGISSFSFMSGATALLTIDTGMPAVEAKNLKLTSQNPAPTCIGGNVGQMYYDNVNDTFYGCISSGWVALN